MGMDARVRYTKMRIRESFFELLKTQPLKKITVKHICELAEINRATFYKYYDDAFDLLYQLENEFIEQVKENIIQITEDNMEAPFIILLERIKEHGDFFRIVASPNGDPQFPPRLLISCYEDISLRMKKELPMLSDEQQKWLYYFLATGFGGMLHSWLEDDLRESPKKLAQFMNQIILGITKQLKDSSH